VILINGSPDECLSHGDGECVGEIGLYDSSTGASASWRCGGHQEVWAAKQAKFKEENDRKYPGWDVPNSPAPDWFDPMYAGERWDEDD
jgi:hypothetical protein